MEAPLLKADMHVHSKYSTRPSEWVLRKIGCSESYTDPVQIYHRARSLGMDLVTITDHNTLAGSLEIAHLENTLVSEEITTYFPEDNCKLHVLAFGITEAQHEDIQHFRENVFDLVRYLGEKKIVHALAHPLYAVNDRLTRDHFCRTLLLFKVFEMNGSRDEFMNRALQEILSSLRKEDMDLLAERFDIEPCCGDSPWDKSVIGGSDDHSSLNIATSYTEISGASSADGFLRGIVENRSSAKWKGCAPQHLAQNLYSIAYQFYRTKFSLERYIGKDLLIRFIERSLSPASDAEESLIGKIREAISSRKSSQKSDGTVKGMKEILLQEGREIVLADPLLKGILKGGHGNAGQAVPETEKAWFSFVNQVSERVLRRFADSILVSAAGGDLFDIFQSLGSAGSLYTLLAPYFVSYTIFSNDRRFSRSCLEYLGRVRSRAGGSMQGKPKEEGEIRVAHFTDTFHEVNGVATTLKMEAEIALRLGKHLRMITCGTEVDCEGVKHFTPVGSFELPEYPELKLYYPPLLAMLDYCHKGDFTHIHSATPGPIGLAALAIARILKIPIYGTYHTALPQYVNILTGDHSLEEMMWRYSVWYYNQMDVVYVPSIATGEELEERGVKRDKIRFYPRGIDIDRFHPAKRNGFFRRRLSLGEGVKLLYVGRVSKEKNLGVLVESFKDLTRVRPEVSLIVVGDGPFLKEMQESLRGFPAYFTGYLSGEDLAEAYASSDIFLFPSATDTFGNVVLEAQASGLPVVVTDEGGPRENLIQGETGYVVPTNEKVPFEAAILRLVDDPSLRDRMGRRAREYMQKRSFEAAFLELWDSYKTATGNELRHS
ncbi:MAG: glycosyltransferase [Desulfobacteraceae bacterium]|jgi:glycosyltransferase involved in cell wall biosynthesis|nr:MAG: glycosyltransferase [Desulfobacteraceae bacterium]